MAMMLVEASQGWETFFLVCFGVGMVMSLIAFFAGTLSIHLPSKLHVPSLGHHAHVGSAGAVHGAKLPAPGQGAGQSGVDLTHVSAFNFPSMMAFLAWFGAVGYLCVHHYYLGWVFSLGASLVGGVIGGGLVYMFLKKMVSYDGSLDPADYRLVGAIGTLSMNLRAGGTSEMVYVQGGARKTCAARADGGEMLAKGTEVVITRFEKGIAYVKRWEDWARS